MKRYFGTAYDTNPARLAIMIKRNKKEARRKGADLNLFSVVLLGIAGLARFSVR